MAKASGCSVTCSLLSQYLRERCALRDLPVGMPAVTAAGSRGKPEVPRTMNKLPGAEAAGGHAEGAATCGNTELFPRGAGFGASEEKKPDHSREVQRAQMTIFYGGKVVVFDNFPADKAEELVAMAGRGCATPSQGFKTEQPAPAQCSNCPLDAQHNSAAIGLTSSSAEAKSAAAAVPAAAAAAAVATRPKPTQPAASDLPIARRVSLHRFLEKRKDRINAKAPYPLSGSPVATWVSPTKVEEESRQWLGLAPHVSKQESPPGGSMNGITSELLSRFT